jgi:DNA-binding NarL/FixJ family response regulator
MNQHICVLIADDRLSSRNGLKALLATQPTIDIAWEASDGQEAIQLVEQCRSDVVLMDLRMPVIDGLQATRIIKDRWPEVKVIALTMYPSHQAEALLPARMFFWLRGVRPRFCCKRY